MSEENITKYLNVLQFEKLNTYTATEIKEAYEFFIANFKKIETDNRLYTLDKNAFKNILVSDFLNVPSEEMVFDCVKKYMNDNILNPEEHLHDFMDAVRLPLVSSKYLMNVVEPLVNSNIGSRSFFLEALRYHLFPEERDQIPVHRMTPRNKYQSKSSVECDTILYIGSCYYSGTGILEVYSKSRNEWSVFKDYNLTVRNFAVGAINNCLMLIGGYSIKNNVAVNTVLSIDLKTGDLSEEIPLNDVRFNMAVAVVDVDDSAKLFVIGGAGAEVYYDSVERWDPNTREWSSMSPMSIKRQCCAITVFDNKIYVAGGFNEEPCKSMDMYDPKNNIWTNIRSANTVGGYCSMVATDAYIYLVGGYPEGWRGERNSVIERYHPESNTWSIISSATAIGVRSLIAIGNKIIFAGGHFDNCKVEEFDPKTKEWKQLASTKHSREYGTLIVATVEAAIKEE